MYMTMISIVIIAFILYYLSLIAFLPITLIQTVDIDSTLPFLKLNGYKFHCETFGDPKNQIIIALHGGPGGDYRYMLSLKELSKKYFIIMYDQRMTGLSSRNSKIEISIQSYYDDLHSMIDFYGNGKPVHLVGHSWGAMMASGYIGLFPEKVNKIVLIEPGILRADLAKSFLNLKGPKMSFVDYFNILKIWLNKWRVRTTIDPHARNDYFLSFMHLYLGNRKNGPEIKGWRMGALSIDKTLGRCAREPEFLASLNFIKDVDKFEGDVLFLTSELNKTYGADYQKGFLKFYKHAKQEIVPKANHVIFVDQPEVSNMMIDTFLCS